MSRPILPRSSMSIGSSGDEWVLSALNSAGVEIDEICGRPVMLIPITDWGYAPIDPEMEMPHQKDSWVLVLSLIHI